ncbi:hypothetical protein CYJ10_26570 [Cupriavidus pauculus]|uniref:Solute-binding protein family 5 domain-containing protein n=1 Tax=Cupriavidus pauculus TaxID=82633 RepID=A0A2N5C5B4_9BURK|nr:hypothetical protein CYJ10_26570 [Cupriavidus pauculus]
MRKAIALAFDFESRYGTMYRRTTSWFPNSELAANANAREFSQSAPRLFEGTHDQAIADARKLLAQAGWHLRNGVLREVDQLIDALVQAKTRKSQVELARALDSKLLNQCLIVPFGYLAQYRLAYREELAQPKVILRNYTAASWVVTFWWSTGRNPAGSTI